MGIIYERKPQNGMGEWGHGFSPRLIEDVIRNGVASPNKLRKDRTDFLCATLRL